MKQFGRIAAVGAAVVVVALFFGWWQVDGPGAEQTLGKRSLPLTQMDFSLTDQDGKDVGPQTLLGQPSLIFFGFTYCPDVCPTTLSDISLWLEELGAEAKDLNAVFISVDPERDTVEVMADYISYFDPRIQGWTGTDAQLAVAVKGFRATYEKVMQTDGDYTMNHTSGVFVFDDVGDFVTTIDYHEPREFALPKIRRAL
ncbi:protein SCO1/2 [Sulfitobacter undariae]|uniref:Protein SCO1/2 n=1 Tax=Sulfitobacter undariae TaxID=1563671 RepID=A0A7W6E8J5_9RHOB|nr:SCO family protein [Sulfitobacter undariae]MBB3995441.1 protein SCO1/2 [Sulfitobacter undariae]